MGHTGLPRRGDTWRYAGVGALLTVVVILAASWPADPVAGAYGGANQSSHEASVAEAYELSGVVASPRYKDWYWVHSDNWEPTDVFAACTGLTDPALAECQQVQRARIWALRIDPGTLEVREARPFSVADPAWALDPFLAQNNDWEDISLGPPRSDRTGAARVTLVLAATGSAANNRVRDAGGRDLTCETRRLIELSEPDLDDPAATTWSPWKIYDLRDVRGTGGLGICDIESLVVADGADGEPTAFLVSRMQRKLFARSLVETTGRAPWTPPAAVDSDEEHRPAISHLGGVRDALGLKITAADINGSHVSMLVAHSGKHPCEILTWPVPDGDLGATLTEKSPTRHVVTCDSGAEGLAYMRSPDDPSETTDDLLAVADANENARSGFGYWHLPYG